MMPTALFRFEASSFLGAGHAVRSMALAERFQSAQWHVILLTSSATYDFMPVLRAFPRLDPEVFHQAPFSHDVLIIDHYDWHASQERQYRPFAKKTVVIDDLANRPHDCDVLIDATLGRQPEQYESLVPPHCQLLLGSAYALLRPAFFKWRPKAFQKRKETRHIQSILISMGGGTLFSFTAQALHALSQLPYEGNIDVVLGFHDPKKPLPPSLNAFSPRFKVHTHVTHMETLIYEADYAIAASGTSIWERCCLGLPSILMKVADNQTTLYQTFIERNLAKDLRALPSIFEEPYSFSTLFDVTDGLGCNRVFCALTQKSAITFRAIQPSDKALLFQWQQEKDLRKYCLHPRPPTWETHEAWFEERIIQKESPFWMIQHHHVPCGVISLLYRPEQEAFELGWYLSHAFQKQGLGSQAVYLAAQLLWPHPITAFAKKENCASQKALHKAGFQSLDAEHFIIHSS